MCRDEERGIETEAVSLGFRQDEDSEGVLITPVRRGGWITPPVDFYHARKDSITRMLELTDRLRLLSFATLGRIAGVLVWLWWRCVLLPLVFVVCLGLRLARPVQLMMSEASFRIGYRLAAAGYLAGHGAAVGARLAAWPCRWLVWRYILLRTAMERLPASGRLLLVPFRWLARRYLQLRAVLEGVSESSQWWLAPFRPLAWWYWAVQERLATLSIPWRCLVAPFRWLHWRYVVLRVVVAESTRLQRWFWPLLVVHRAWKGMVEFALAWVFTRNYRLLWGSIPAVLLTLPLLYVVVCMPLYSNSEKAKNYLRAARDAWTNEQYAAADLFYRRVQQLGGMDTGIELEAAVFHASAGNSAAAYQRLQQQARSERPVFAPAHLWIARAINQDVIQVPAEEKAQLIETHLKLCLAASPSPEVAADARQMLTARYLADRRNSEALPLLESLVDTRPGLRIRLARLYRKMGYRQQARTEANRAVSYYTRRSSERPLSRDDYLRWTAAYELLEDSDAALGVLEAGIAAHSEQEHEDPKLTGAMIRMCTRQLGQWDSADRASAATRWDRIRRGLECDPAHEELLEHLVRLVGGEPDAPLEARRHLDELIARDQLPARLHKILGDYAANRQDFVTARARYQDAVRLNQQNHASWNNLAWILGNIDPIDLDRGLEFANRAVAIEPSNPHYRETRGQILVRLGRWVEAVADLEAAVNGMPERVEIHESLARVYEALGTSESAAAHRQIAQRLRGEG